VAYLFFSSSKDSHCHEAYKLELDADPSTQIEHALAVLRLCCTRHLNQGTKATTYRVLNCQHGWYEQLPRMMCLVVAVTITF